MPVDHSDMKQGRSAVSPPTPELPTWSNYSDGLPEPKPTDWSHIVAGWPLLENQKLSTCTICAPMHLIQTVTAFAGNELVAVDDDAVAMYSKFNGYVPTDPSTDLGGVIADVLTKWHLQGMKVRDNNDKILAFVRLDPANLRHIKQANMLLGPLIVGARLPTKAATSDPWLKPQTLIGDDTPGSWADHCMMMAGWNDNGAIFSTWDIKKYAFWGWWDDYVDEAWAVLHPAWMNNGKSVSGFPYDVLIKDMQAINFVV